MTIVTDPLVQRPRILMLQTQVFGLAFGQMLFGGLRYRPTPFNGTQGIRPKQLEE